jgi:hypothetical protein
VVDLGLSSGYFLVYFFKPVFVHCWFTVGIILVLFGWSWALFFISDFKPRAWLELASVLGLFVGSLLIPF